MGVVKFTEPMAAMLVQKRVKGHQYRSGRFHLGGKPFTDPQRRRLEDALSVAVDAAMGLVDVTPAARIAFVARHIAAQENGIAVPEAPKRVGKLSESQAEDLARLVEAATLSVNACNNMRGVPLRNVAEHLFGQYRREKAAPVSRAEAVAAARRNAMRAAAPQHKTQSFANLPAEPSKEEKEQAERARLEAEASDPLVLKAKEAAKATFEKYDANRTGEIGRDDLFKVLLDLGQVPGVGKKMQQAYLAVEFNKADKDGSGTVDYEEFVDFYTQIITAGEAEKAARHAFTKYDVGGDNLLQKFELFQVLIEYGMVTGDTKAEKDRFLETEFKLADADGSGGVDFDEFIAFYLLVRRKRWGAELKHKKEVQKSKKAQRKIRTKHFLDSSALVDLFRTGEVALLSARWWLERAGYERSEIERNGKSTSRYTKRGQLVLIPCRQVLEKTTPEAYLSVETIESLLEAHHEVLANTRSAERDGVGAAPVVVTSHCWVSPTVADPSGETLAKVAEELARQMPLYEAWGFADVGVFFDWASLYQDTVDITRTAEQDAICQRAIHQMPLLFAHKLSTTFLITDARVEPPRVTRAWPFYEETLVKLFKEAPPPKRCACQRSSNSGRGRDSLGGKCKPGSGSQRMLGRPRSIGTPIGAPRARAVPLASCVVCAFYPETLFSSHAAARRLFRYKLPIAGPTHVWPKVLPGPCCLAPKRPARASRGGRPPPASPPHRFPLHLLSASPPQPTPPRRPPRSGDPHRR